ncbi:MAG: linear amide C-N hydrolase [Chlorobiaceae bacterium]
MITSTLRRTSLAALLCAFIAISPVQSASACSRAVYFGKEGQTVTGRTMDWLEDMHTNLWIFPQGIKRDGGMGDKGFKWTSRYGSVIASIYEAGTADGMNEQGLVANLLFLSESKYPDKKGDNRPQISISAWTQYILDNFATVSQAVAELRKEAFRPVIVTSPNGVESRVHISISDATGDSAIFEYIDGKLVIHHGRQYQVMTNSPTYDRQISINEYWKQIGGTVMLPGTNRPADRFARASFYINATQQSANPREAVAAVFSVMRNVSVPRGISTPSQPNISSTIWRTVADQKNKVYFFEDTFSPGLVWVRLKQIDFKAGSGIRKLTLDGNPDLGGDQTVNFKEAKPFLFLAPQ